ncbi:hypothetical protein T484DRAFT_3155951 [Baffinella frigidus]|nr:hypothetical protein T484DRAFT_3155951 [Cryptophyta sp. CCMP2293]
MGGERGGLPQRTKRRTRRASHAAPGAIPLRRGRRGVLPVARRGRQARGERGRGAPAPRRQHLPGAAGGRAGAAEEPQPRRWRGREAGGVHGARGRPSSCGQLLQRGACAPAPRRRHKPRRHVGVRGGARPRRGEGRGVLEAVRGRRPRAPRGTWRLGRGGALAFASPAREGVSEPPERRRVGEDERAGVLHDACSAERCQVRRRRAAREVGDVRARGAPVPEELAVEFR